MTNLPPSLRVMFTLLGALFLSACQLTPATGFTVQQEKMLASHGFVETTRGWELSMADRLLFDFDESRLKPDQLNIIANIGAQLKRVGIAAARVEGHADAIGTHEYNAKLSQARAEAVAVPLRSAGLGLPAEHVLARGAAFPIGDNNTAEGRADNRRVVIIVTP